MKKIALCVSLVVFLITLLAVPVFAAGEAQGADQITVIVDSKVLDFDVPPQNVSGRILVPLRVIFEEMGASIVWDSDRQTVTATKDDITVALTIGDISPTVNGGIVPLDQPGVVVDGRTLAPLRFVAEAFGGSVVWDGETQTATITTNANDEGISQQSNNMVPNVDNNLPSGSGKSAIDAMFADEEQLKINSGNRGFGGTFTKEMDDYAKEHGKPIGY